MTRKRKLPSLPSATPWSCSASGVELLEDRSLLAADMLVSVFDDTNGLSVLRYNEQFEPVAGGVATSPQVAAVQGLTVAPDGTFFVSSLASGSVFRYDSNGTLLAKLGEDDATPPPIIAPGALAVGPNGNLYVTDLQTLSVYQFDISTEAGSFLPLETLSLGYTPGGFDFDAAGNLIVGDLVFQSLNRYDADDNELTVLIEQGSGLIPAAVLVRPDGDIFVGDITFGFDPMDHHQVVLYDIETDTFAQFINLTFPVGTGEQEGYPPQPSALAFDPEGNLLVGLSPDHNLNGQVQKYNATTGAFIEILVENIGTPTAIAFVPDNSPVTIPIAHIFYNQSVWDGNSAAIDPSNDNAAIATDKTAYRPNGTTALPANVTSYTRGINGIMVDLPGGGNHAAISASDFVFKVGNNNSPSLWAAAPAPSALSVVPGGGVNGSDRVIITWAAGAIRNTWLEVQVLANANTGLAINDVFFWGNKVADSLSSSPAGSFETNPTDSVQIFSTLGPNKTITDVRDYNRDGQITPTDSVIVFSNIGSIVRLNVGAAGPFAATSDDLGIVASALAVPAARVVADSAPVAIRLPESQVARSLAIAELTLEASDGELPSLTGDKSDDRELADLLVDLPV